MRPIRNSAKAIIVENNCLLAITQQDPDGFYYILPGGGQEPGETLHRAVQRECWEELGAEIEPGALLFVREYIGQNHEFAAHDDDVHQVEFMFECRITTRDMLGTGPLPDDNQIGIAWLPLHTINEYRLYPLSLRPSLRLIGSDLPIYLGDTN